MAKSYFGAKPSNTSKLAKSKNGSFWVDFEYIEKSNVEHIFMKIQSNFMFENKKLQQK
jgi:hypothetical protein